MTKRRTRVLVVGASGMLGHTVLRVFAASPGHEAWGTVRGLPPANRNPSPGPPFRIVPGIDLSDFDALIGVFSTYRPDITVNCAGVVKQLVGSNDPLTAIPLNALVPHRLALLCELVGSRLIHVSTDCVFDGQRGAYVETDPPNARDLYGLTKYLGEVDLPGCVTLRTSVIGPQLEGTTGLVSWFLAQVGSVPGYTKAVFSGLSTLELARVMKDYVMPFPDLRGVYHVSAAPITKCDLLVLLSEAYQKSIEIIPDDRVRVDRSLDSSKFREATGYTPPTWFEMIRDMKAFG